MKSIRPGFISDVVNKYLWCDVKQVVPLNLSLLISKMELNDISLPIFQYCQNFILKSLTFIVSWRYTMARMGPGNLDAINYVHRWWLKSSSIFLLSALETPTQEAPTCCMSTIY